MDIKELEARVDQIENFSSDILDNLSQREDAVVDAVIAIIKALADKDEDFAGNFREALIARGRHGRAALTDAYFAERNRLLSQLGLEPDRS